MRRVFLLLFLWIGTMQSWAAEPVVLEHFKVPGLLNSPSYSQATSARGGKLVFVSGQIAWDEKGVPLHPGDLEAQTRKAYENVKLALTAAGATFDDVVKFTVYVKDLDAAKWKVVSKVRSEYVSKERPSASTMIGVTGLVYPELHVEIEAYAVVAQ